MFRITQDFIAAGGNRHPSAADWSTKSGILAFGTGINIATWQPLHKDHQGIANVLTGHSGTVNALKFFHCEDESRDILLSGSADSTIRIWVAGSNTPHIFEQVVCLSEHVKSINSISVLSGSNLFVSGAADSQVKVWSLVYSSQEHSCAVTVLQSIELVPKFLPLALSFHFLPSSEDLVLAVAGSNPNIYLYVSKAAETSFSLVAALRGHEGWIRSLSFIDEHANPDGDLILASASQDKYIRLWRFHSGEEIPVFYETVNGAATGVIGRSMSNKIHRIKVSNTIYSVTFEALLLGHEDWIYSLQWSRNSEQQITLLSASADGSLAIWEADPISGIWISSVRLGEISAQKGATTATGSTGGFWIGFWSPDGQAVVSLGRTGSWRLWKRNARDDRWIQCVAIGGHTKEVKGISWSKDGSYLLSTSSDQTTRLFAEWKRNNLITWHELSRPQIHGYDLNCIDSISHGQFISGADEKLLRVFNEPMAVAQSLFKFCGVQNERSQTLPEAANMPVLGLSNKAIGLDDSEGAQLQADGALLQEQLEGAGSAANTLSRESFEPPLEDHLARHLLWPEAEKLYGHGYEISAVAASHDASLVATACRASSIDHALIRLFDTEQWREIKSPLKCHSLTVTSLKFSSDDKYLLSVGRDRQCAIHIRSECNPSEYSVFLTNTKAHARMLLDASWAPIAVGRVFATAGRDKTINIWRVVDNDLEKALSISASQAVTAVSFLPFLEQDKVLLAFGLESGALYVCVLSSSDLSLVQEPESLGEALNPSKAITQLRWRPLIRIADGDESTRPRLELAVASDDHSLRIYNFGMRKLGNLQ